MASSGSVGITDGYGFNRQSSSFNNLLSNLMNSFNTKQTEPNQGLTTVAPVTQPSTFATDTGGCNAAPRIYQEPTQPRPILMDGGGGNAAPTDFGGGNTAFPTKPMNSFGQTARPFSMGNNINRPKVGGK